MSKKSKVDLMYTAVHEISKLVHYAAAPAVPGEKVAHAIARAARHLKFTKVRTAALWYGTARRVEPEELEIARKVALEQSRALEVLRNEYNRAREILARLEVALATIDQDFTSEAVPVSRNMAGRKNSAGNAPPAELDGDKT